MNFRIIKTVSKQLKLGIKSKIALDSLRDDHKESIESNKSILKSQKRFRSENHNIFPNKDNKIETMIKINSIETYSSEDLVCKKVETTCNKIIKP